MYVIDDGTRIPYERLAESPAAMVLSYLHGRRTKKKKKKKTVSILTRVKLREKKKKKR